MRISLSPDFVLRNYKNCSFIIGKRTTIRSKYSSLISPIPPFIGYILSEIGKGEFNHQIKKISDFFKIKPETISSFINKILTIPDGGSELLVGAEGVFFPDGLLVKNAIHINSDIKTDTDFDPKGDFIISRPTYPFYINLMVTTKCTTNCVYCYANRKLGDDMRTDEVLRILRECKDKGVINVTLTGGDIFRRDDWKLILKYMNQLDFSTFISTKTPLSRKDLEDFKSMGYDELQFSLDSVDSKILSALIKVDDGYFEKVEAMFSSCDQLGIDIQVRTVLTKLNASIESIDGLRNFLAGHKCVAEHDITPAFFPSSTDRDYSYFEIDKDAIDTVYNTFSSLSLVNINGKEIEVRFNKVDSRGYLLKQYRTVEEYVEFNQTCRANVFALSILANGDCTVCEMCYKCNDFLLGNLMHTSLYDVWNGTKALEIFEPKQDQFPIDSPCSKCKVFEKCRGGFSKHICYSDLAKIYGEGKTYSPDPRCPLAEDVEVIL
jgi:hypothetical protein